MTHGQAGCFTQLIKRQSIMYLNASSRNSMPTFHFSHTCLGEIVPIIYDLQAERRVMVIFMSKS